MAQATHLSALFGHFLAYGSSLGSFAKLSLLANRAFPLRRASFTLFACKHQNPRFFNGLLG
jgi:hypothetical protein